MAQKEKASQKTCPYCKGKVVTDKKAINGSAASRGSTGCAFCQNEMNTKAETMVDIYVDLSAKEMRRFRKFFKNILAGEKKLAWVRKLNKEFGIESEYLHPLE